MEILKIILPTINSTWLNQQPGNRAVSAQRLTKCFGSHRGIILELKRIITSSKLNNACAILVPNARGCFFVSNIFWRKNKR